MAEQSADRCRQILFPKSVAVIGASQREDTLHGRVVRNLLDRGFPGDIYPVNPRYTEVAGLRCYPTPQDVGKRFDVGLLLVSAARTVEALDGCIAAGAPGAAVFSSGFGEAGPAGRQIETEVAERRRSLVIAGPNCNGILSQPARAAMGFAPTLERTIEDAPRAIISQSGAVATAIATRAHDKGLGFRYVIATGNEVDLGVEDYLFFLASEQRPVSSCLLFLETIRDVPRFAVAAMACRRAGIRLIALKVGRSARAQAVSATHTGALAGPMAMYRALFDRIGVWSVSTIDQLILCAQLEWWDDRADGGLAFLAFSGGQAALAADEAEAAGLPLPDISAETASALRDLTGTEAPTNPFDCSGQVVNDPARWHGALRAMVSQPGVDGLVAFLSVVAGGRDDKLIDGISERAREGHNVALAWPSGHSPLSSVPTLRAAHVPLFERIEDAVGCLAVRRRGLSARSFDDGELTRYLGSLRPSDPAPGDSGAGALDGLLRSCHISTPREARCHSVDAALAFLESVGGPVVAKAGALLHKSDAGGVALDLRTAAELSDAMARISSAHGFPVLLQQQVSGIRELLVGFSRTELGVGTVVGAGGVLAEVLADTATLLAPCGPADVIDAIDGLAVTRLLRGYRNLAPADLQMIADFTARLSSFALENPQVESVDLNPLIISDDGRSAWAVDRKVVTRTGTA
jgi:acyl-CoA synthetase (NDP forming)